MADYVDITLYDEMDEPPSLSFTTTGGKVIPTTIITDHPTDDGFETVYRIQLSDLEKA